MEMNVRYFRRCLDFLPSEYLSADTNRMTLIFFCISGLDILSHLPSSDDRINIINWIYSQYINQSKECGFRGGPFHGNAPMEVSHIAMTYTAISTLIILGDSLDPLDKKGIIHQLEKCQTENGSFTPFVGSDESDMRFLYCACAISYILDDWTGIDKDLAVDYIKASIAFDGALGQGPHLESHGGSTYCGIASLCLMDRLHQLSSHERSQIVLWCVSRQKSGFQGRPEKPVDSCYSFWIGASLEVLVYLKDNEMLGAYHLVDIQELRKSLTLCQKSKYGGFSKLEGGEYPDLLHSYLGLGGLSLSGHPDLQQINAPLNLTRRALNEFYKNKQTLNATRVYSSETEESIKSNVNALPML